MDLDRFKSVNDRFGHPVGDQVLREVAQLFKERLRVTDIIARLGGEEFAVLLLDSGEKAAEGGGEQARLSASMPSRAMTAAPSAHHDQHRLRALP